MFGRLLSIVDKKEVLVVPFHKIFFPGVFFEHGGIGSELLQLLSGGGDLLLVVLLAFLQFLQLGAFAEMAGDEVPAVEEDYPDGKTYCRQQVLVLQPRGDMRQQLHKLIENPDPGDRVRANLQLIF